MANTFTINVTRSTFRLHGTADYQGSTYKFMGKTMTDFDEAVVEAFLSMDADRVELVTDVPQDVADSLSTLTDLRTEIEAMLGQRQNAYRTAVTALETAGWSRKDAARMVGVNPNTVSSILSDTSNDSLYGVSMLNAEPASLTGGVMVLGAWEKDGNTINRDGEERVGGMTPQIQKLWAEATAEPTQPAAHTIPDTSELPADETPSDDDDTAAPTASDSE